jgi:hypothetical protein
MLLLKTASTLYYFFLNVLCKLLCTALLFRTIYFHINLRTTCAAAMSSARHVTKNALSSSSSTLIFNATSFLFMPEMYLMGTHLFNKKIFVFSGSPLPYPCRFSLFLFDRLYHTRHIASYYLAGSI